jgi:hypothetical protein
MTIRLVFTTSIITSDREQLYVESIRDTMKKIRHIPLKAYVVENNGQRSTALDTIEGVEVLYTNTNNIESLNEPTKAFASSGKGQKEMLDVLFVGDHFGFEDTDLVIKLTGRYTLASSSFFDQILSAPNFDVYMKFWDVCRRVWDPLDCVMGLYACRYNILTDFDYTSFRHHCSTEKVLAEYFRSTVSSEKIYEVKQLDMYFQGDRAYCV